MNSEPSESAAHLLGSARLSPESREALERLLERNRNYLHSVAEAQLGPWLRLQLETSDVVQETLIEANRDFEAFQGDTLEEFQAWLRRILCHNVQDKLRYHFAAVRDVRRLGWIDDLGASSDAAHEFLAAAVASPSGEVQQAEQALLVADALWSLPDDYRAVLIMRHIEGASFATIAERLDRSEDAARKLWTRALVKVRDRLRS